MASRASSGRLWQLDTSGDDMAESSSGTVESTSGVLPLVSAMETLVSNTATLELAMWSGLRLGLLQSDGRDLYKNINYIVGTDLIILMEV
jgi:hypothetical protein